MSAISHREPFDEFARWFAEAQASEPRDADAMTVATVTPAGAPAARMILLKGVDERGFVFYTNLDSRKGGEIDGERGAGFRAEGARAYRRAAAGGSFSFEEIIAELLGRGRDADAGSATAEGEAGPAQKLRLGFVEAALGGKRRVSLADGREVEITVPAGIDTGQTLRLRTGAGRLRASAPDEIRLEIVVEPHSHFRRKDQDIHIELPVTVTEAVLGATVTVPTLRGSAAVKVPRGSNSGSTLRLKGRGITADGKTGDQYVKLRIVLPDPPDPELTAFLERWGATHGYDVRGKLGT